MQESIDRAKKALDEMRYNYLKDISHLKEYMFMKDKHYTVDYLDVRFFEASKDLDIKTQAIINEKVAAMGLKFNSQIH